MVHVEYRFNLNCYHVYVVRQHGGDMVSYLSFTPEGKMSWSPPEDGTFERPYNLTPTYIIPEHIAPDLLKGLTHVGVVNPPLTKIEGLYEAQSKHLTDLQHILGRLVLDPKETV